VGIEGILGISLERGAIRMNPCIPRAWPGFEATVRLPRCRIHIVVENPDGVNRGVKRVEVDGVDRPDRLIPVATDDALHRARVIM
jgi:cyclic beta-1,2-glucan synthetase